MIGERAKSRVRRSHRTMVGPWEKRRLSRKEGEGYLPGVGGLLNGILWKSSQEKEKR